MSHTRLHCTSKHKQRCSVNFRPSLEQRKSSIRTTTQPQSWTKLHLHPIFSVWKEIASVLETVFWCFPDLATRWENTHFIQMAKLQNFRRATLTVSWRAVTTATWQLIDVKLTGCISGQMCVMTMRILFIVFYMFSFYSANEEGNVLKKKVLQY